LNAIINQVWKILEKTRASFQPGLHRQMLASTWVAVFRD
jgi:hypothetical protein